MSQRDADKTIQTKCSLCGDDIEAYYYGLKATPLAGGYACATCHAERVLPHRIRDMRVQCHGLRQSRGEKNAGKKRG